MSESFNKQMKDIGLEPKKNQTEYYRVIHDFLKSDKKFFVARGGMGLGKSIAAILSLKTKYQDFDKFYIATPFAKIKNEWAIDLNRLNMNYAFWLSKKTCIVPTFHNRQEDCDDECPHRIELEANGEFTALCRNLFNNFKALCPITANEYYAQNGDKHCLWPIVKSGLKSDKIVIGDYFPFFNPSMLNNMIFDDTSYFHTNSVLIIDEAHKLPNRIKNYFSTEMNIESVIKALEEECCEVIGSKIFQDIMKYIPIFKTWINKQKTLLKKHITLQDNILTGEIDFKDLMFKLRTLETLTKKKIAEYDEDQKKPSTKLLELIEYWGRTYPNKKYINFLDTKEYFNKNSLYINIKIIDISEVTPLIFNKWKKVLFISGTIDEEFKDQLGIPEIEISEKIDSFNLNKNVLIYSKGDFTSRKRTNTLNEFSEELKLMVNKMKGRIIIFVPAISMGSAISDILNEIEKPVFDICKNREQELKTKLLNKFSNTKNGICLYGLRQGIEGQNLLNENDGMPLAVENCIVLGYPFVQPDEEFKASLEYFTEKYGNKHTAKRLFVYHPMGQTIHQALARSKRNEYDEPCCVLVGKHFLQRDIFLCLPNELKQNTTNEFSQLMNFIEVTNEKRKR